MRMEKAANEIKNCMWFDYIVINDDLNEAIDKTQAIILSERCKTSRQASVVETLFNISVTDKGCLNGPLQARVQFLSNRLF